jgi:hypothetical protein
VVAPKISWLRGVRAAAFLAAVVIGLGMWPQAEAISDSGSPPVGEKLVGLKLFEGWTDPRALPEPVNTSGWEDSAYISSDGTTLYFGYTAYDYHQLQAHKRLVTGPNRPGQSGPAFDIYSARFADGAWRVTHSTVNSPDPNLHEAAIGVNRDGSLMAFVRFDPEGDIYLVRRDGADWGRPARLPSPVNTPCVEDNPHLSPDGDVLYFDSNRGDPRGLTCLEERGGNSRRTIYVARREGGRWSVPEPLREAPNETRVRWQVFLTEDARYVYWSGLDPDCRAVVCISRAERQSDGSYRGRTIIAEPAPPQDGRFGEVIALGEVSITADGRFLYFVYMMPLSAESVDLSIGVARRAR